jgi:hypothetical protein
MQPHPLCTEEAMALKQGSKRETGVKKSGAAMLRGDRVYGHAAQKREHSRGSPGRERPAGSKVRQSRTEPAGKRMTTSK